MDIKIYDSAKKELDNLISAAADNKKYIRIFIRTLSFTYDARIHLTLDELNDDDIIFDIDGYKVIINKRLASQMTRITISFGGLLSKNEFSVDTNFGENEY
ncbi:MAG: hypothetical protein IJ094_01005 [Bacilli bacterium]|nr:hypothetical protein [Bacilli bacterium]